MSTIDVNQVIGPLLEEPLAVSRGRGDAIGFVGTDVPIEVLLATGRPFGHLPWQTNGDTPWADRWLESSFPYWARSILEQWHAGAFDSFDTVVFSRADDASQRLFYYVAELQRRGLLGGPAARVFDIALVRRESSVSRTAGAILALCDALDVDPALLPEATEWANRQRRRLADLDRGRVAAGPFYERLGRAALWTDPTQWIDDLVIAERDPGKVRVLLAGSVPPDDRLHGAVESTEASVIAETHAHGLDRLGPEVEIGTERPEKTLALHLQQASVGPRAMIDRGQWIVKRSTAARADAVIIWLTREDEALAWHLPAQQRALAEAGIPALVLPAGRWQADDALDRIVEFCRKRADATA